MSVKIIQIIPMPNDLIWQGAVLGLGSDGVTYEFDRCSQKWVVCLPLEFGGEDKSK